MGNGEKYLNIQYLIPQYAVINLKLVLKMFTGQGQRKNATRFFGLIHRQTTAIALQHCGYFFYVWLIGLQPLGSWMEIGVELNGK